MPSGTGLDKFEAAFPDRTFDVGIAEQHAVTFAAGLAAQGHRPFCAIYSTFLQRAYDQVVHDVAIQNLPVRFAMDRAGLVGADGCTHAGSFDLAYLCTLAQFRGDGRGRRGRAGATWSTPWRCTTAARSRCAIRAATAAGWRCRRSRSGSRSARAASSARARRSRSCRSAPGSRKREKAADMLEAKGLSTTVADLRFAKPLDEELIRKLLTTHEVAVTIEEGVDRRASARMC